jgi:HEAT repeat protein
MASAHCKFLSPAILLFSVFLSAQQQRSATELVAQFNANQAFWEQFEVATKIAELRDPGILPLLKPWLSHPDRHLRGNAAFVFARLGDNQGFEIIKAILEDSSDRPPGQGVPGGPWSLKGQIASDRYYAVHLLGDLKDPRGLELLIPLLKDEDVNWIVPWSLGEIGEKEAIAPLLETLDDPSPDMRVLAIFALEELDATEAIPKLRALLSDGEKTHFDKAIPVGEAAKEALAKLESKR